MTKSASKSAPKSPESASKSDMSTEKQEGPHEKLESEREIKARLAQLERQVKANEGDQDTLKLTS